MGSSSAAVEALDEMEFGTDGTESEEDDDANSMLDDNDSDHAANGAGE